MIFLWFFLVKQKNTLYFVIFIGGFPARILIDKVMIETQETNLPIEEGIATEETGKLEESQAPVTNPAEKASEMEEQPVDATPKEEIVDVQPDTEVVVELTTKTDVETEEVAFDTTSEAEDVVSEAEDAVSETEDAVSETEDAVSETEDAVSETEDAVLEVEDVVSEAEDVVSETEDAISEVEDAVSETEDVVSEAEDVVSETEDAVSETEDAVSEAEDAVPEMEDAVSETEDAVSEMEDAVPEMEDALDDENEEEIVEPLTTTTSNPLSKYDIIARLQLINTEPKKYSRNEVDTLKQTYYRIRRAEIEAKKKAFLEDGGEEQDFVTPEDETEASLKSLIAEYKEKQTILTAEEERQKETNLILKQHLIERLKILTESQDNFNKRYNEFREIQRKWREIRLVPQEYQKELWRNYQLYNERFYDIVKINNQFRDYDFKKNLEMKTVLCEAVERLAKDPDVVSAFHQLQKLHEQWREIGPASKEFRDSIWERFKAASALINKNQQSYFENLKGQEAKNLERKKAICEELEAIDYDALKTMKDWEKKTEEVVALQARWRKIGFATKRQNVKVYDRFRTVADNYFIKKNEYYKSIKREIEKNLEAKKALIAKAESLKESVDWKETTKAFVEMQNEWKKIGPVGRRHSEAMWKQFIAACDYFFERKNKEASAQKSDEYENLEAKKAVIGKIKAIDHQLSEEEAVSLLRDYISEWNAIGFVAFKEKDRLHKAFREAVDKQFDRLKVDERDRRIQQYRSSLTEMAGGTGKNKLYNERDKLMRTYDRIKNELQTYENNIGFISSKGGGGLLKEIDRKIARLREEMETVVKKIEAIDANLD